MNLIYFTSEAYRMLKSDMENNHEKYYGDEDWLGDYFISNGIDEYVKESSIVVPDTKLLATANDTESKNAEDLINIKTFYSDYKDKLTPLQACDARMWSALCHIEYSDYIRARWGKGKDPEDETDKLEQRFFLTNARSSMLYYNALSRLWWSGYLTYEEEKEKSNPWALTNVLMSAQQVQKDLFDTSFSMNRDVVKGVLRALERMQFDRGNACTSIFRRCCWSYLNHYGAVAILDSLGSDEIEILAYDYMKKISSKDV